MLVSVLLSPVGRFSHAQEKTTPPIVAVFVLENRGSPLTPDELQALTDYLSTKLGEGGHFQMIPRQEIKKRLTAQKKESFKACYDQSCQIEVGRELAAQLTVSSSVSRVGSSCILTAGLFALKKGATINTATARATCDADALIEAIEKVADKLKGLETAAAKPPTQPQIKPQPQPVVQPAVQPQLVPQQRLYPQAPLRQPRTKSTTVACLLSFLPGGGMYYLGKWGWGTTYLVGIIGGLGLFTTGIKKTSDGDSSTSSNLDAMGYTGLALFLGIGVASLIHTYVAADNWKDPDFDYTRQQSNFQSAFVPTRPKAYNAYPALVFPVFGDQF